jgi:hypothetical protein
VTGYTAILCGAGPCRAPLLAAHLRDTVGASRRGALLDPATLPARLTGLLARAAAN